MSLLLTRAGAIGALAALPAAAGSKGVPVLMYHAVNNAVPRNAISRGLTVPVAAFADQLAYLEAHGIPTLTAGDLVAALASGGRPSGVVLTFDDGYADMAQVVAPLLARYHARATFFVNSGSIGTPNHLTWAELRGLRASGNEIGAHGQHHLDLTTLNREGQLREAGGCVDRIAEYTGFRPLTYAYASGRYNRTTFEVMRAIGIRSAWTEHSGTVREVGDPYQMPRLRIARNDRIERFAAIVAL